MPYFLMSALMVLSLFQEGDGPNLALTVESSIYSFEPAFVRVRVRVEPNAQNRRLTVGLVSDGFSTSSDENLAGDQARISRWLEFRDVPAGEYTAVAYLLRTNADPLTATVPVYVLSSH